MSAPAGGAEPSAAAPGTSSMRAAALATLREVLGEDLGTPCALLDFPRNTNVGDAAIWLGTLACLEAVGAPPPAWTCDDRSFDPRDLVRHVPRGPILVLGGGNFGDLHRKHQALREAVVAAFPDRRIVQLPQTIHFDERPALERARRAFGAHRRLTVLVRDERSLRTATDDLGLDARLAPDLAVGLPPPPPAPRERRILWLARTDEWSLHEPPDDLADVEVSDWPDEGRPWARRRLRLLGGLLRTGLGRVLPLREALMRTYTPLARWRVERGLAWLSRASVVVTDRLHGHLLALLAGTPHVLLDDDTGKVAAYHAAWTRGAPGVVTASDALDAIGKARALLAEAGR